ncbi:MAG: hypothetical protein ACKVJU_13015 [Verrucomicrobiales bacterium]
MRFLIVTFFLFVARVGFGAGRPNVIVIMGKDPQTDADGLLPFPRGERWKYFSDVRLFDTQNDLFEETLVAGSNEVRARFTEVVTELRSATPKLW